jgi:ABC-type Fe3+/spermidine/putrescine transport system ATPase subunit
VQDSLIRVESVTKRFGMTTAVNAVDLDVAHGEFFGLLGPSGCGKTTLLRMIGGFIIPDTGRVVLDGEDVTLLPPNRRPTNMVFQSYALFPHLNVHDNVGYGLRSSGLSKAEREARIAEALALVRLAQFGARRPHELSGGERQRVALARALIMRPKVLLLDEPLGALDKRLREAMQIELRAIQRELGISFIFVTHDQEEALSMSDRVGVMDRGRLLQVADPKTLYEKPNSRAVASFIGTMNFLPGRIRGVSEAAFTVEILDRQVEIPRSCSATPFVAGDQTLVGLRPEKLTPVPDAAAAILHGRVEACSYFGDRQQLQVSVSGLPMSIAVALPSSAAVPQRGNALALAWARTAPVLLPPD